jgi:hypothetical protein
MALYHKWDVKTGFTFALQFFMLISDGLGGVIQQGIQKKLAPLFEVLDHKTPLSE